MTVRAEWHPDGSITLRLPSPPSSNRWWRNWRGRMVKSTEARVYQAGVAMAIHRQGGPIRAPQPVSVTIRWYRDRKSGDLDKRVPIILDALQGIVYDNDAQVVELHAYRYDEKPARLEVVVKGLER